MRNNVWSTDSIDNILSKENLEAIQRELDDEGPIIVEHWFYFGGSSPDHLLFIEFSDFMEYLNSKVKPGDAIDVWSFHDSCTADNALARAKYPDEQGRVPRGGAY